MLKATIKESELPEGSKEFLLPDPRASGFEECCCHSVHGRAARCPVSAVSGSRLTAQPAALRAAG